MSMNPYILIGSGLGTAEAAALSQRLAAWHDAMVMHERRLRAGRTSNACDDDCEHGEARALWAEAVATFGDRAHELSFLRSRAISATPPFECGAVSASVGRSPAFGDHRAIPSARQRASGLGQLSLRTEQPATPQNRTRRDSAVTL